MNPAESALPRGLEVVATWSLNSVADLAEARADLESRLPCDCPAAHANGRTGSLPASLSGTQRLVLVASELVANGLEHAEPPITVRLLCDGRVAVLDVADHSPDALPMVPHGREPGAGGHGLRLAATVADRVAWFRTPTGEKHVWALFAAPVRPRPRPLCGGGRDVEPVTVALQPPPPWKRTSVPDRWSYLGR